MIERILRHRGEWGPERTRGPPAEAAPVRAEAESRARRVVVDEYVQEFAREDESFGANVPGEGSQSEAERREWDWGA